MADLHFFTGTMDCGKSTLALQMDYNHRRRGLTGLLLASHDRGGDATVSSRLGLSARAVEVGTDTDLWGLVVERLTAGTRVDYVICDEAQFYTPAQIDDLGRVADELDTPVYAFGILTDFRTRLFPGAARLVELADRMETLQVEALCWCGRRATHNARTVDGVMVTEGRQVVVGDTGDDGRIGYEVLCRHHHRRRMTATSAGVAGTGSDPLPFAAS
ncbi:thymidine kinase [Haloactinopolyspora alba]|uniref:Thymidine kinase n=1 Tax=Haloactinopolyspora alba TaxID=648780 RepID=A0A2P8E2K5_9ACTN|nr:thymidine kinase [Haloactinopolyspora alba]PSL03711.1 thymidine kinase [Haloactinopolyspora alba]